MVSRLFKINCSIISIQRLNPSSILPFKGKEARRQHSKVYNFRVLFPSILREGLEVGSIIQ
jgi:hypothetical protein